MVPAFFVIALIFGLPESPRWLYQRGQSDEALQVLCDVYDLPPDAPKIIKEQSEILDNIRMQQEAGEYKWSQLFKRDEFQTGRRVLLTYGLMFIQQLSGVNLIVYYVTSVLQVNVGLERNLSLILGGCINLMFALGMFVPAFFLDRMGRRRPVMVGSAICGFCMMMIAILLSFSDRGGGLAKATSSASVAFFFLFMLVFGACTNSLAWVYLPEILPLHARNKGPGIGASSGFLWNFFVVQITPTLINDTAWKSYLIVMATNFIFVPTIYLLYPETSNLPLEEIDWLFLEPSPVKYSLHVAKHGWKERRRDPEGAGAAGGTAGTAGRTGSLREEKTDNGATEEHQ